MAAAGQKAYEQARLGQTAEVLMEEAIGDSGLWIGHTPDYLRVGISMTGEHQGELVQAVLQKPAQEGTEHYIQARLLQ